MRTSKLEFARSRQPAVELLPPGSLLPSASRQYVGNSSCMARACHGNPQRDASRGEIGGNEHTLYAQRDPHAGASAILYQPQARRMAELLGLQEAHTAKECLVCHAPGAAHLADRASGHPLLVDGVACEACHGPASGWLVPHTQSDWRLKSAKEKSAFGFRGLRSLADRAERCADCHVGQGDRDGDGRPDADVNHDLIAAGHPRLTFEFASYHHLLPKHWTEHGENDRRQPQNRGFEARLWAIGQAVATQTALTLLADRAQAAMQASPGIWPEFAEYNCHDCHRAIPAAPTPGNELKLVTLPAWGHWQLGAASQLLEQPESSTESEFVRRLALLKNPDDGLMRDLFRSDPRAVAREARLAARAAADWRIELETSPFAEADVSAWRRRLSIPAKHGQSMSWEQASQLYLAHCALQQAQLDFGMLPSDRAKNMASELQALRSQLLFPQGRDGPRQPTFDLRSFLAHPGSRN